MIRSIRFTLTLWHLGILTVVLCGFSGVLYINVAHNLDRDIDNVLVSHADGIADSIFAYWKGGWDDENEERAASLFKSLRKSPAKIFELEADKISSLVAHWADETGESEAVRPVRILDPNGKLILSSKSFEQLDLPVTDHAISEAKRRHTVYETFRLGNIRYRLVTLPVIEAERTLYLIQVASTLIQADASLRRLRLWLLWLVPSTLAITGAMGWFLVSAAFLPVGRMITQARKISAQHLHQRLDVPRTGDELERLSKTFNDMLARLERTFRRLRQFSSAASHELRTPLTVMRGELELALRKTRDVEEYQRVIKTHLDMVQEMTSIVEQLLMLGRSEEGEEAIDWRLVDLNALVKQVHQSLLPIVHSKGIGVHVPDHSPVWIRGEKRLLERLIANLVENALKHTPSGGHITVKTLQRNGLAALSVQDTGVGIKREELPQIFDKFFSEKINSQNSDSTGLGLGLCRWIAEAHHGRIEVWSEPGQGSTFRVLFPLENPNQVP